MIDEELRNASHRGSHQRRTVYRRSRLLVLREPDLFSVSREPGLADHRPRRRPKLPFRQVGERPAADLTDEDIERSIAVREKDHELAVRRDRGIDLLALEVGQTHGPRVGERVLPEIIVDPQAPGDAERRRENTIAAIQPIGAQRRERPRSRRSDTPGVLSVGADAVAAIASSISIRASAMSRRRRRTSFRRQRSSRRRMTSGVVSGTARQSGSCSIRARACRSASRPRTPDGRSASHRAQPNAQMSVRLSTGRPRACSGLM